PWSGNRWLRLARQSVPYPRKQRTPDETPLGRLDLERLHAVFPDMRVHGFQLLSMLGRVLRQERLATALNWCDALLLRRLPRWQQYCRYVVLVLAKESS